MSDNTTSIRPELIITRHDEYQILVHIVNPSSENYVSKRFFIDSRLPLAKKLTTVTTEYKNLLSDEIMRELTRWLLIFFEFPTTTTEARLLSFLEMIEMNIIDTLLPEPAEGDDIAELRRVFGF